MTISRRDLLKAAGVGAAVLTAAHADAQFRAPAPTPINNPGWVVGNLTGADALVETLLAEGADCVFGIPGAQENEIWDAMKTQTPAVPAHHPRILRRHHGRRLRPLHRQARRHVHRPRSRPHQRPHRPGRGAARQRADRLHRRRHFQFARTAPPFQVHALNQPRSSPPVTKHVFTAACAADIPLAVRQAFQLARAGEPGPVGVVIPYNLLIQSARVEFRPARADPAAVRRSPPAAALCCNCAIAASASASTPAWAAWIMRPPWSASPNCCKLRSPPACRARASSPKRIRSPSAGATGSKARAPPRRFSRSRSMSCWRWA